MWEWLGPLLIAVGSFLGVLVGLYLRVRQDARKGSTDKDKQQVEAARKERRDAINEWQQVVESLRQDRNSDRELVHDLREDMQQVYNKLAINQTLLEECVRDRLDLRRRVEGMERQDGGGIVPHGPGESE
jgi:uncharacterized membrane-anchored protein YhcB (DUF1043 family)